MNNKDSAIDCNWKNEINVTTCTDFLFVLGQRAPLHFQWYPAELSVHDFRLFYVVFTRWDLMSGIASNSSLGLSSHILWSYYSFDVLSSIASHRILLHLQTTWYDYGYNGRAMCIGRCDSNMTQCRVFLVHTHLASTQYMCLYSRYLHVYATQCCFVCLHG